MKTLLRNRMTGCYFQGVADWHKEVAEAFDFRSPERVARFVLAAGLNPKDLELILAFGDPRYNVSLPIDERYGVRGFKESSAAASNHLLIPGHLQRGTGEAERHCLSVER